MTVMSIGIVALVAGFSSGFGAINRASTDSTAGALADQQMEAFRRRRVRHSVAIHGALEHDDRRPVPTAGRTGSEPMSTPGLT